MTEHPLKQILRDRCIAQHSLARKLNIHEVQLKNCLRGERKFPLHQLQAVCEFLGEDYRKYINTDKECA